MMNEELNLPAVSDINTADIDAKVTDIVSKVLDEEDVSKTKDLMSLFNWNMSKKNMLRVLKLNNLYDDVTEQMIKRFAYKPDQFSNDDLLNYMKTVQGAITNSSKIMEEVQEPAPAIIQNNTQINLNVGESFSRESRERILAAVQATLNAARDLQTSETEYEDKTEGDNSNESV